MCAFWLLCARQRLFFLFRCVRFGWAIATAIAERHGEAQRLDDEDDDGMARETRREEQKG